MTPVGGVGNTPQTQQVQQTTTSTPTTGSSSTVSSTQIGDMLGSGVVSFAEQGIETGDWGAAAEKTIESMGQQAVKMLMKEALGMIKNLLLGKTDVADAASNQGAAATKRTAGQAALNRINQKFEQRVGQQLQGMIDGLSETLSGKMDEMRDIHAEAQNKAALRDEQAKQLDEKLKENKEIKQKLTDLGIEISVDNSESSDENGSKTKLSLHQNLSCSQRREVDKLLQQLTDNSGEIAVLQQSVTELNQQIAAASVEVEQKGAETKTIQENGTVSIENEAGNLKTQGEQEQMSATIDQTVEAGVDATKDGVRGASDAAGAATLHTIASTELATPYTAAKGAKDQATAVAQDGASATRIATATFEGITSSMAMSIGKSLWNKAVTTIMDFSFKGIQDLTAQDPTGLSSMLVGELKSAASSELSGAITDILPKPETETA